MKTTLLTLAATIALGMVSAPAEAVRPVAGYDYLDLCRNVGTYAMPGKQTVLLFAGGYVEYVDPSQEPNLRGRRDCQPGPRSTR